MMDFNFNKINEKVKENFGKATNGEMAKFFKQPTHEMVVKNG